MRNLTQEECFYISGAGDRDGTLTVSPETVGGAIGAGLGAVGGTSGAVIGTIVGGAVGNYLAGERTPGSVGPSGIPWGSSINSNEGPIWGGGGSN
ncbi:hypothetical protein PEC301645_04540 [Pectobacterium carotovorum subsp. carotovorum]|uniref:Colicin V family bacteriocin n=1 Tax=Pectobacterium aroidearum TaxID=1201031 RepID=A0AAW3STQ5_9GAMM|nr:MULTISPECIES: colicin V family bacteriocin [Pectobacterium]MBA5198456.1 colicin V family bacteriocin [Pectobacterium aroidearum]MBA5203505.1 colicin V family bacteriocin [Pectobacterium aroidearum]MBA5227039.1 colicin V family bacteriocin [Pectobacterium aroidearum]MBA5235639.1 colicin V family bacteriocin [Pectobacterium aroidearum]UUE34556.1 colicin V family bacteriocin [Pectobacterium aroidearum]